MQIHEKNISSVEEMANKDNSIMTNNNSTASDASVVTKSDIPDATTGTTTVSTTATVITSHNVDLFVIVDI